MIFKISFVQFNPIRKDVSGNITEIQALLSGHRADLVVLPELANSGYLYKSPEALIPYTEPSDGSGEFLSAIQNLAKSIQGVIITGYAENSHSNLYNSASAVSPDGVIVNYRKSHLYADEKILFRPGDSGFKCFDWLDVRIGMMICFDWIFPESARTLALAGAQIIAHPANLILPYCQDAMITRSIENKIFTITANRIGHEELDQKSLKFTGQSQMTHPSGTVLFRAPENEAIVITSSINPNDALNKKISYQNDLFKDRRPGIYGI